MSDRRRRRKCSSENSEEISDGSGDEADVKAAADVIKDVKDNCEPEDGETDNKSEYESAEEEDIEGSGDERPADEEHEISDEGLPDDEFEERQQGDGQERPLDDDEDRRNPQYIPKKGTFYEHDDRTAGETKVAPVESVRPASKGEEQKKKKVWKEEDSWVHDKFIEKEQIPKSREELVAVYGYDIRSEDCPPRARRRRRYGRGPNKYTRTWEDVNAYKKRGAARGRPTRGNFSRGKYGPENEGYEESTEDFPDLNPADSREIRINNYAESNHRSLEPEENKSITPIEQRPTNSKKYNSPQPDRIKKSYRENSRAYKENTKPDYIDKPLKSKPRGDKQFQTNNIDENDFSSDIGDGDASKMKRVVSKPNYSNRNEKPKKPTKISNSVGHPSSENRRLNSIPPRLQDTANRPKRYSSLRQRGPTDSTSYPQESTYYDQNYQGQVYPESSASATGAPTAHVPHPNTASYSPQYPSPPPFTDNYIPRSLPNVPTPPSNIFTPSGGHTTQPIVPTAFMPNNGSVLNYGPPPAQFPPPQYAFQGYPPQVQVSQPQEIFSNGVAYYSPQPQLANRVPQKRPKAAIPILPPPDNGYMHDQGAYIDSQGETIIYDGQYEFAEQCGPPHLVPCQPLQVCEPDQAQPIFDAQPYVESNTGTYLNPQHLSSEEQALEVNSNDAVELELQTEVNEHEQYDNQRALGSVGVELKVAEGQNIGEDLNDSEILSKCSTLEDTANFELSDRLSEVQISCTNSSNDNVATDEVAEPTDKSHDIVIDVSMKPLSEELTQTNQASPAEDAEISTESLQHVSISEVPPQSIPSVESSDIKQELVEPSCSVQITQETADNMMSVNHNSSVASDPPPDNP